MKYKSIKERLFTITEGSPKTTNIVLKRAIKSPPTDPVLNIYFADCKFGLKITKENGVVKIFVEHKRIGFTGQYILEDGKIKPVLLSKELSFYDGYICAVANILLNNGDDVVARDVLNAVGKVDPKKTNPEDYAVLKKYKLV